MRRVKVRGATFGDGVVFGHPAGEHGVLAQPVDLGQGPDPLQVEGTSSIIGYRGVN